MKSPIRAILLITVLVFFVFHGYGQHPVAKPAGAPYVPPPLPPIDDIPWPLDPPDAFTDPFSPDGFPDPVDLPFPPEDPFDDPLPDLPLPPDPWDVPDPLPDLPSLFPDPFDLPLPPPSGSSTGHSVKAAHAVTNRLITLMPFPMRIPFHPEYSGKAAPRTGRICDPNTASTLIVPESKKNTVAFFSTCPWTRTATVTVGQTPTRVVYSPDGTQAFVPAAGDGRTSGNVTVISLSNRAVAKTITFPAADANGSPVQPNNVAILPDGSRAYVTSHACNPGSFVYIIDLSNYSITGTIPVGCYPSGINVSPDGTQLWVGSHGDNRVDVFDTATNVGVAAFNIQAVNGIAFNPTGTTAYIAEGSSPGNIVVVDTSTFSILTRIPVGNMPHSVKVTPTGRHVFVANALSNSIMQISTSTNKVIRTINLPNNVHHPLGLTFIR